MSTPRLSLQDILYIGIGGMLGSLLRSWLSIGFAGSFPVPTLLINILGAGALALLHVTQHRIHQHGRYLYMVGFCGSFTTVSLFSLETVQLFRSGQILAGFANIALPIVLSLTLVILIIRRLDRPMEGTEA